MKPKKIYHPTSNRLMEEQDLEFWGLRLIELRNFQLENIMQLRLNKVQISGVVLAETRGLNQNAQVAKNNLIEEQSEIQEEVSQLQTEITQIQQAQNQIRMSSKSLLQQVQDAEESYNKQELKVRAMEARSAKRE